MTRLKVERAIEDLGFVRNDSARQLRAGVSHTVAYLVLDVANPFFIDVMRGMDEVAAERRFAVYLCTSEGDPRREDRYLEQLLEQRVKGICITPVDVTNPRLDQLRALGMPVVLADRTPNGTWDGCSVGVDDRLGGELATTHLLELGHERIGFVGGPFSIPQVSDRLEGSRRAVTAAGGLPDDVLTLVTTGALTVADGRRAGARILGLPRRRRPTAVVCANDLLALGLLQQMTQRGVAVPDELAIVGYDDIDFAAAAAVPLTSVSQPRHLIGRAAVELLLEEAESPDGHVHRHVQFDPELVVRQSSGG